MSRVFVSGSSTGLGLLAARRLAERGHEVTLHARNAERAGEAREVGEVVLGDLSGLRGMREVADRVNRIGRHEAVIHNAAVYRMPERVVTEDGLSLTFAVNVLAPYLLTALLEPPRRLVFMTSGMQEGGAPDLADAQWERRRWNWSRAYSDSKLHDTMLAFAVARLRPGAFSNAVSPGWVPTRMGGAGAPDDLELGADTQVWLAAGDDPATEVTGRYFFHREAFPVPPAARDAAAQDELLAHCGTLSGVPLR